jgi:hypothetical protein
MTDLEIACTLARRYHLDVFGVQALLADLPSDIVQNLVERDDDGSCTCQCEGCNYSGHCGVNYTGCDA